MRRSILSTAIGLLSVAFLAAAHEYPLQYTPNAGARGLVVAGYRYSGNTVIGTCTYYTVQGGSGRGGGYHSTTTYYNQTCTWDLYGNLLSVAAGAPATPAPLYVNGTQTVYATGPNGEYTGADSRLPGGFVNTQGSHYTWQTSSASTVLQQQVPYALKITLLSDGDIPLHITAVDVSSLVSRVSVSPGACVGSIAVGATCTVTVSYDDTRLSSPTGLAYDTLDVKVVSDAGQASDFTQRFTLVVKVGDHDN